MQQKTIVSVPTNPTVLIVDDQPTVRRIMSRILQVEGYELHTASNGQEAIEIAHQIKPDVILLDVLMPDGLSGFEVCRRLRANDSLTDVPIIMVTALDDRESRLEGIQSGADDFIVKPFDPVELQARVRNITQLNRYRRLLTERLKFEWVVAESDEGYLIIKEDDQITYANARAQLYLNLPQSPQPNSGQFFLDSAREQYNCEPNEAWQNWPHDLQEQDSMTRYLIRPESSTTPVFWLRVTALRLSPGTETLYIVRLRDVTQQMSSTKVVWQLHSMIVHKLRTPLSSILMSLELMQGHQSEQVSEEADMLYDTALQQTRRLHDTLEGMLKYVDSTAIDDEDERAFFALGELPDLVQRLCETVEITTVACHFDPALRDQQILISSEAMSTVLLEILHNAQKFHPQQSPHIVAEIIGVETGTVQVRIIDDGINLSPRQLISVWQPYYQAEKSFTGEIPGTGLGLSAVAMAIWQVGGQYRIYNRQDTSGLVVELTIPIA